MLIQTNINKERIERNTGIFTDIHQTPLFIPDNLLSQELRYTESHNLICSELSRCSCAVTAQQLDDKISMDLPELFFSRLRVRETFSHSSQQI